MSPEPLRDKRLVLVEWEDSCGVETEWRDLPGAVPEPLTCRSVGWLVQETEAVLHVVPHVALAATTPQGCGDMFIPRRAVLRLVDLVETPVMPDCAIRQTGPDA